MTRKMKAILVLFFAAEIVNSAKVGVLKGRIADLETQRDIYASRAQNWLDRAVEDEEVIDSLQMKRPTLKCPKSTMWISACMDMKWVWSSTGKLRSWRADLSRTGESNLRTTNGNALIRRLEGER